MLGLFPWLAPVYLVLSPLIEFWKKLPATVKVFLFMLVVSFGAFLYGKQVERKACAVEREASIQEAKRIDSEANKTSFDRMQRQLEDLRKKNVEQENKLNEAATLYDQLPGQCKDPDFYKRNNAIDDLGSGVQSPIPSGKPGSSSGGSNHSRPGSVQKSPGQR